MSASGRCGSEDRDHITRFDVLFKTDPFSESSLHALERVDDVLRAATAPDQPLEGTDVDRNRRLVVDGSRPETRHHARRTTDVCAGNAGSLCDPGPLAAPAGYLPLLDRHGGSRLSGIAGTDRPGVPRALSRHRLPGAASTGRSVSSSS